MARFFFNAVAISIQTLAVFASSLASADTIVVDAPSVAATAVSALATEQRIRGGKGKGKGGGKGGSCQGKVSRTRLVSQLLTPGTLITLL